MSLESELFAWLKTNVPLVSNRIYDVVAPQTVVSPYLVFQKLNDIPNYTHNGTSGMSESRVQFTACGATYESVRAVAAQLEAVLSGYKGSMGSVNLGSVFKDLGFPGYDPESLIYTYISDYIFTVQQ